MATYRRVFSLLFLVFVWAFVFLPQLTEAKSTFSIEEATIDSVHQGIRSGQLTCESLVRAYIQRIQKYNLDTVQGPPLNAIVFLNPSIYDQARELDAVFAKTKKMKGRLFCIPVLLKDNIDSFEMPSSSGSLSLLGLQPPKDALIVKRMRDEGALFLGKTTMDELASGLWGVSSRSGKTGNAYDPTQNSGGSSSGSAVAVSVNFAVVALGSDNSGSLRVPAAYNGIYTIRSTQGLISQTGIFPRGNLDGVAGPMTRTNRDLAIVLDVISPSTEASKGSYTSRLKVNGLQGKRIGVVRKINEKDIYADSKPEIRKIFETTLQKLTQLGATLVENVEISGYDADRKK